MTALLTTTSFSDPPSEHNSSIAFGAIKGAAIATPSVKANHARRRQVSVLVVRWVCMAPDYG